MAKASMNPVLLDKASYWVNAVYIASVSLTLAVSVIVVFISNQRAAGRDAELKRIQTDSAQQIALADERSSVANQHSAEANVVVAQAESRTAQATLAQEELRKQNLVLSVQLEQEKKLRIEAEERAAREAAAAAGFREPRKLGPEQEQAIAATLRSFADKKVSIIAIGDPEAGALAQQLTAALTQAQWSPVVSRFGALTPPQYGIICTHDGSDKAAIALIETLRAFHFRVYERKEEVRATPEILVGLNGSAGTNR